MVRESALRELEKKKKLLPERWERFYPISAIRRPLIRIVENVPEGVRIAYESKE